MATPDRRVLPAACSGRSASARPPLTRSNLTAPFRVSILKYMLKYSGELDLVFQALGDPTRRELVDRLAQGPASVSELAAPLPISMPAVLQHLRALEDCGLVRSE